MRRASRQTPRVLATVAAVCLSATTASATIVERVVAVVGEQAVLLSELRERARPFLSRVEQQSPDGAQRAAATSQLYAQLVQRLVDEELEQKAANRANITITAREIDDALGRIATQNGVTVARVVEEAEKSGLTEASYRQELRRQLLEAKLLNLRIQGRLRVTDDDVRAAYQRLVMEERKQLQFRIAWIRIGAPRSLAPAAAEERRALAASLADRARRGEDFGALARAHSEDASTRENGGLLPKLRPGSLRPALDTVVLSAQVGDVSEPIRDGDDFVVLKLVERDPSQLPAFGDARDELGQRVYMEKMNRAKQHWMDGLRRQTHVEVRL
ncbi:MAG TPA: peptidylprolyl isomerase [Polyangiaceae bacterium]|nr:peptidylprolyl isomerase [Polyangiaceae bacterium]